MQARTERRSVDLTGYPDLIVVILGFRARRWRAVPALMRLGRGLSAIRRDPPDGLLADEPCLHGWNHIGMRQYWRDAAALAAFTRSQPHAGWWRDFLADPQGAGFWHEAYSARGGMEAVYVNLPDATGFDRFAPPRDPVGPFLSARARLDAHAGRPLS